MITALWLAVIMSIATFVVHTFVGGVYVARPLLADDGLPKSSKYLNYYTWHVTTVMIIFVGIGFALCLWQPSNQLMIGFLSALTAASSVLSATVAVKWAVNPFRFPSTSLFALTSLCGWTAFTL